MNCYKIITVLIIIFFSSNISGQEKNEQLALDYFMIDIFGKKYNCEKAIYVSENIENNIDIGLNGLFSNCSILDNSFGKLKLESNSGEQLEKIELRTDNKVKFLKKPRSRKINVVVYKSINQGDKHYVYLSVLKEHSFVDHYLIKIVGNKAVDYCVVNEAI